MRTIIEALFGDYISDTVIIQETIDSTLYEAVIDYEWLAGVLLFSLTLYCTFRLLGAMIGGNK